MNDVVGSDGYRSRCEKCYAPVEEMKREYHALGECRNKNSGTEHIEWTCRCGHKWLSYPR